MMRLSPATLPPGYARVPPGYLASVVTYLEMTTRPERAEPPPLPDGLALSPFAGGVDAYRRLFRRVGERWLWFSRLTLRDAALGAILADPEVEILVLAGRGGDVGLLELDFREPEACELTFLGLIEPAIGRGIGRSLMAEALRRAWARPIRRFWLHTCSLDHPGALDFYLRSGLRAYARAVEVAPDPRLAGVLPRNAAPHVPLIEGLPGAQP